MCQYFSKNLWGRDNQPRKYCMFITCLKPENIFTVKSCCAPPILWISKLSQEGRMKMFALHSLICIHRIQKRSLRFVAATACFIVVCYHTCKVAGGYNSKQKKMTIPSALHDTQRTTRLVTRATLTCLSLLPDLELTGRRSRQ